MFVTLPVESVCLVEPALAQDPSVVLFFPRRWAMYDCVEPRRTADTFIADLFWGLTNGGHPAGPIMVHCLPHLEFGRRPPSACR